MNCEICGADIPDEHELLAHTAGHLDGLLASIEERDPEYFEQQSHAVRDAVPSRMEEKPDPAATQFGPDPVPKIMKAKPTKDRVRETIRDIDP